MRVACRFAKVPFYLALFLVLALSACSDGQSPETMVPCGGQPDLHEHMEPIQAALDFDVLVPTYLPATTSSIPEPTLYPLRDEIEILFARCPDIASGVPGPQIQITETTQELRLADPGSSLPSTERLEIRGASALITQGSSGDTALLGIGWQQAGLSLSATFMWGSRDGTPPEITPEMKAEALRVVESIIEQGEATGSG